MIYDAPKNFPEKIHIYKERLHQKKPVIHHITNFVTIYQCARITSFLGASPIMAYSCGEAAQVTAKSDALVINTGTLNDEVIHSIPRSVEYANTHGIPVVLDPVGLRLSDYRYDFIRSLLDTFHFDVIRCNAVELLNLDGEVSPGKGIDGASTSLAVPEAAEKIAARYHCVIACTGAIDYISDGTDTLRLSRGVPLLPRLVGTGCMVNSLIASYLPVADSHMEAAALGILTMCIAGEMAESCLEHPLQLGSFETFLMDAIAML